MYTAPPCPVFCCGFNCCNLFPVNTHPVMLGATVYVYNAPPYPSPPRGFAAFVVNVQFANTPTGPFSQTAPPRAPPVYPLSGSALFDVNSQPVNV